MAVQIAKTLGAEVTGVCGAGSIELVRSLEADNPIDYTKEDFIQSRKRFDVILDNVLNHPPTAVEVLDETAVRAYRRRFAFLDQELAHAD